MLVALQRPSQYTERPLDRSVDDGTAGRDLTGEGLQEPVELARAIEGAKTGEDDGPKKHGRRPDLVPGDALKVLGERKLARLILAATLDQGQRRSRPPRRRAVMSVDEPQDRSTSSPLRP